jgi:glucan-binding YG repeat protein
MIVFAFMISRTVSFAEDSETGWRQIDNKWFYFYGTGEDAFYRRGVYSIDGKGYLFEQDGSLVQNQAGVYELSINYTSLLSWNTYGEETPLVSRSYTINAEGVVQAGWCREHHAYIENEITIDYWYYIDASGELAIGWKKIDGKWFYFSQYDRHQVCRGGGTDTIDNKRYVFGNDGALVQNQAGWYEVTYIDDLHWKDEFYTVVEGYTIDAEGVVQAGWHWKRTTYRYDGYSSEDWYYLNENGEKVSGWKKIDGKWYYFGQNQLCRNGGVATIDGKAYLFGSDGALVQNQAGVYELSIGHVSSSLYGSYNGEFPSVSHIYTIDAEGVVQAGWCQERRVFIENGVTRENWFYIDANGELATGWKKIDGKWFYFSQYDAYHYQVCREGGTCSIDDKMYLFGNDGALVQNQAGWYELSYIDENYYGTGESCTIVEGYTIDAEGAVQAGWHLERTTYNYSGYPQEFWYYLDASGHRVYGWKKIDGKWYYFNQQQVCRNGGTYSIDGKTYVFGTDGALLQNQAGWYEFSIVNEANNETTLRGYTIDAEGAVQAGWSLERIINNNYGYTTERWYYVNAGGLSESGWKKIDGEWYYFDPFQVCRSGGFYTIDEKTYIFGDDGALIQGQSGWYEKVDTNSWGESYSDWYYLTSSGEVATGWKKINGRWYYFKSSGVQLCRNGGTGTAEDGKCYMFDSEGALVQNQQGDFLYSGYYYYLTSEGEVAQGWKKFGTKWYYYDYSGRQKGRTGGVYSIYDENAGKSKYYMFDADGALVQFHAGLYERNNQWYYLTNEGEALSGWQKIDGKWYLFDDSSIPSMICPRGGTYRYWDAEARHYIVYLFANDGSLVQYKNGWYKRTYLDSEGESVSEWYYLRSSGEVLIGNQQIGGEWYYFGDGGVMYANELAYDDGKYYYYDGSGKRVTTPGWRKIPRTVMTNYNGRVDYTVWIYLEDAGEVAEGWKTIGGEEYYFDVWSGMVSGGAAEIEGIYYLFSEGGALVKNKAGWNKITKRYDSYGKLYTENNWYYIDNNGIVSVGLQTIGGKEYYFDEWANGKMVANSSYSVTDANGDEKLYLFGPGGERITKVGWHKLSGWRFEEHGSIEEFTEWFYVNESGVVLTGWNEIGGKKYYLNQYSGALLSPNGGLAWFYDLDLETGEQLDTCSFILIANGGARATGGWYKLTTSKWLEGSSTNWYYANEEGVVQVGWQKIGGKWYYFDESDDGYWWGGGTDRGKMYSDGLYEIDGRLEYFDVSGACLTASSGSAWRRVGDTFRYTLPDGTTATGMQKIGTKYYYFASNGNMETGWKRVDGKWYYFDPHMLSDTIISDESDGNRYLLCEDGSLAGEGLHKCFGGTSTYYTNSKGIPQSGWKKIDGKWYYFKPFSSGYLGDSAEYMYTDGSYLIDGKYYRFAADGAWTGESWVSPY